MRKFLLFLSLIILALPVAAQAPKPKVVAKPGDKPAEEAPKRGVMSRIFGKKPEKVAPTPTPTPAPTPAPKKKTYRPKKPTPAVEKPDDRGEEVETEKPKPSDPEVKPPAGNNKKNTKKGSTPPPPANPEVDEKTRYNTARGQAEEDAAIKELKTKADGAVTDAEAHTTSVAYNKALYRKIREIDPSLDTYVDRLEQVMMKRLNSETKGE